MISRDDMPAEHTKESMSSSPYSTVSRFTASRSSPSMPLQKFEEEQLSRTDSLPPTTTRESSSPTKPSMPWMMPTSTRGAGGFVASASAALKRSSTMSRTGPVTETTEVKARPMTMYGRSSASQRDVEGVVTSTGRLTRNGRVSPRKHQFDEDRMELSQSSEGSPTKLSRSFQRAPSPEVEEEDLVPPKPPPHRTPLHNQADLGEAPTKAPQPISSPPHKPSLPKGQSRRSETSPQTEPSLPPTLSPPAEERPTTRDAAQSLRLSTSTSADIPSRKRWSPTKSSWLDSALQHPTTTTPGSPPKRTSSIRPIPPAVPHQPGLSKWTNETSAAPPKGSSLTKSTSFTSALGGSGGRRDVAGISAVTRGGSGTSNTFSKTRGSASTVEARLAALERRTQATKDLPRSQSLCDNLFPVTLSRTPSPPQAKPKWDPTTTTAKPDTPRDTLLAARSGLNKAPPKAKDFSDPLKEGILAAKERLRVQDKPREKREDELKTSILNARKGLKRTGSQESVNRPSTATSSLSRKTTPIIAEEAKVKVEDVDRESSVSRETTPLVDEMQDEVAVKVEMRTFPVSKVEPLSMPTRAETEAIESLHKVEMTPPSLKVQQAPVPTKKKSIEAMNFKPSSTASLPRSPPIQKAEPTPPAQQPVSRTASASSSTTVLTAKDIEPKSPPQTTSLPPNIAGSPMKPIEKTPPRPTPETKPAASKTEEESLPKTTTVPVQKKELDPSSQSRISVISSPKKDNDSPTPQKKFPNARTGDPETPIKSPEPAKSTPSPLATTSKPATDSVKGITFP